MEENKKEQEGLDPREREQILPDDQGYVDKKSKTDSTTQQLRWRVL